MEDPNRIAAWLAERYGVGFSSAGCELLRSYTNDVYQIRAAGQLFALKLYGLGWRTAGEVRWELDLLRHLAAHGVPVAGPIAAQNRESLQLFVTEAGPRIAVLFAYAPGEKPQPPFSTTLYEAFGQAIAQMHQASDSFVTSHPRQGLDIKLLIDEPVALAAPLLSDPEQRAWLRELAGAVKERLAAYAGGGLGWGPIHGDATLDNLHVTDEGTVVLYDFDSAGPGWRSADLQGWASNHAEYQPCWDAFHRGYRRVRPLAEIDLAAAPYLTVAWDLWGLTIDLERRILPRGPAQAREYVESQLVLLRERSRQYRLTL